MHHAISMKVLGQTHMRYVLKHIWSNFLNFSLFMWFWIFYTHKNKSIKVRSNAKTTKTMHIKRCMMHKCMTMKHLMYEESYKDWKIISRTKRAKAQPQEPFLIQTERLFGMSVSWEVRRRLEELESEMNIDKEVRTSKTFSKNLPFPPKPV